MTPRPSRPARWRRIPRRRTAVAALVASLVVALVIGQAILAPAPAAASEATLTILEGSVRVSSGEAPFEAATDGQLVRSGDVIRTGDATHAVLTYFDGSTTTIEPLSELVVEQLLASGSGQLTVSLLQNVGHTWHVVTHSRTGTAGFQVRTPVSSAVVRGTAFEVKVRAKPGSPNEVVAQVATTDGTVGVRSPAAPDVEVAVPEGKKTDVEAQAAPRPPEAIPAPDVTVKVTLDAVANAVVVQQNGLAVGVQHGQAVRYAPGSKVKVENGKLVMEIPNAQAGRLSSVVQGASTGATPVHIETEISSGSVVVAKTTEDRPYEVGSDPARSAVAKGGIILTPVGVVVLPDDEAKKAAEANIGKAPPAPSVPAGPLIPIPRAEQRPDVLVTEPAASVAPATVASQSTEAPAPFRGTFQAFVLTGIAPGPPIPPGVPLPPAAAPTPGVTSGLGNAIALEALSPQLLSVLFASNPGHKAGPLSTGVPEASPVGPSVAPGAPAPAYGFIPSVICGQSGQPLGCIPAVSDPFAAGGIFAPGGIFGAGGLFDANARRTDVPGASAAPRGLFTPTSGAPGVFCDQFGRPTGCVPQVAPAGGVGGLAPPCGITNDPRCSSTTPIQGITCGFVGGPTCPSNALPPGSTAPPGAIPGSDGTCGLPGLRGCFAGETPRPGLVQGAPVFCDQRGQPPGCVSPFAQPGVPGTQSPSGGFTPPGQIGTAPPTAPGVFCDQRGQPPGCIGPQPGVSFAPGVSAAPIGDGNCGSPGLRPCFAGETSRPGAGRPALPYCDGSRITTDCVPPPGGYTTPSGAPVYCDQNGQPPGCIPQGGAFTPQPASTYYPTPSGAPVYCDQRGQPPGCIQHGASFAPGSPPPTLAPGQVWCDNLGRPAGCVPPPGGVAPASGTPVYCDQRGQPSGCIGPQPGVSFAPGVSAAPIGDGNCGSPGLRPCFAGETSRPGAGRPALPYCDGSRITTDCVPPPGGYTTPSGAPVYCDQRGQPSGCIGPQPGVTFAPGVSAGPTGQPVLPQCDGFLITTNCVPPAGGYRTPAPASTPQAAPTFTSQPAPTVSPQPAPTQGQIGTAPPTAPGVYCSPSYSPAGCIQPPLAPLPSGVPATGAPVYCDQNGQPPGCIPQGGAFTPQPASTYYPTPSGAPVYCDQRGQPAGCIPQSTSPTAAPTVAPSPTLAPTLAPSATPAPSHTP